MRYDGSAILGLLMICFWVCLIGTSIYGLVLAFSASILLGFVVMIVEPAPLIIGLAKVFWSVNLAQKFMEWVNG